MKTEFKVMPWLRALRERNAQEEAGLTIEERLRRTRERAAPVMREFMKNHPKARQCAQKVQSMVAEEHGHYGTLRKRRDCPTHK